MLAVLLAALESDEDKQKFTEIYELYHVQMEQTAIRILKDQHDAEDAVQNAFMQIIRHFEKIYEIPCEKLPFWIICIRIHQTPGGCAANTFHRRSFLLRYQNRFPSAAARPPKSV